MSNDRSELRWGVEQRLEFIEFRLFWEGHVNRSDVMEQFGLVNQASSDLSRYIGFRPSQHGLRPQPADLCAPAGLQTGVRQAGCWSVPRPTAVGRRRILDHDNCWIAGTVPTTPHPPQPAASPRPTSVP